MVNLNQSAFFPAAFALAHLALAAAAIRALAAGLILLLGFASLEVLLLFVPFTLAHLAR